MLARWLTFLFSSCLFALAAAPATLTLRDVPRAYDSADSDRILVADLDADGNPDVITDGFSAGSILYGRGGGSLEAPVSLGNATSGGSTSAVIADVDRDRLPDVIFVDYNTNPPGVVLRHNLGHRQFEVRPLPTGFGRPMAAADFTGDGSPDLLLTVEPHALLLVNDGHGGFPTSIPQAMTIHWRDPAVGDVDGDGDLDVAVQRSTSVDLFINDGRGRFEMQPEIDTLAVPVAADLDRDRRADILALRYTKNEIALHRGSNVFAQPTVVSAGRTPLNAAIGDFNHDGALDVTVLNDGSIHDVSWPDDTSSVITYLGDGNGNLTRVSEVIIPQATKRGLAAADFNRDGALDLAVPTWEAVGIVLGNGDGTFRTPPSVPGLMAKNIRTAADLNGDGIDELILELWQTGLHAAWMNADGTYRFDPVPVNAGSSAYLVATLGGAKLVVATAKTVHVLSSSGPGQWSDHAFDTGDTVTALQTLRSGADWSIAVVIGTPSNATLKVFTAAGTQVHAVSLSPSPAKEPFNNNRFQIDSGDADRDGITDLIVAALGSLPTFFHDHQIRSDASIRLFRGRVGGSFAPAELLLVDRPITAVAVADFNADGALDIGVAAGPLSTLFGDGAGHFLERNESIGLIPNLIADLNLDGLPDFKKGATVVYGTRDGVGKKVRYLDSAIGSVLARRKRNALPALVGTVAPRGDFFFIELDSPRARSARH